MTRSIVGDASDILEIFRPNTFDNHVRAYRAARWMADKTAEFALRRQAVEAGAAEIIARAQAARRPAYQLAAE